MATLSTNITASACDASEATFSSPATGGAVLTNETTITFGTNNRKYIGLIFRGFPVYSLSGVGDYIHRAYLYLNFNSPTKSSYSFNIAAYCGLSTAVVDFAASTGDISGRLTSQSSIISSTISVTATANGADQFSDAIDITSIIQEAVNKNATLSSSSNRTSFCIILTATTSTTAVINTYDKTTVLMVLH
jgi:hypothetical protein